MADIHAAIMPEDRLKNVVPIRYIKKILMELRTVWIKRGRNRSNPNTLYIRARKMEYKGLKL